MRLRLGHLHVPSVTSYQHAAALQSRLVHAFLASKSSTSSTAAPKLTIPHGTTNITIPPGPSILTFEMQPVYTCGRREIGTISPEQQAFLRANGQAQFVEAQRGGQTTFHGPGQLVAYPIIDLREHNIRPRCYVRLLENSVIATLARYGIKGFTTDNPGVWTTEDKKIAAVGVHLRRNVTSHGIGLNVNTDLWWFNRIVACGLEGKQTTSLEREGVQGKTVEEVGAVFAHEFGKLLGAEEMYPLTEERILELPEGTGS
ncbi:lipoate-protein ligase-like protein B [Xylona heveae TC161]|uniref:Octanoyltransferase n=1 Tax=Xylona heveae (strain CBS 132557 / TC161) TaxID=1328760 RepID=A0A165FY53_XYLHT|nr:lipoate-protein ligase-like protein B [Xylona heveae TC161]KZF21523.1 lipoate-protein ligase-like protein B [Xylona heveae TC161]